MDIIFYLGLAVVLPYLYNKIDVYFMRREFPKKGGYYGHAKVMSGLAGVFLVVAASISTWILLLINYLGGK